VKITTTVDIDDDAIESLLVSALEGGSNYWYMITESSPEHSELDYYETIRAGGWIKFTANCDDEPFEHDGKTEWLLDRAAIARGLQVMAVNESQHFADILNENDDANTGDVFLQCCLFGEVIFG
jgi:hypothetical protein